jgi:hypothetical protein
VLARPTQLSVQSRAVGDGIREKQVEAGVPAHKILSTHKKGATRWGGHKLMVTRNIVLRPAIDPTIDKFKRENRGKADAIVESNEAESGSKGGVRGRGLGDGPLPLLPLGLGFFARARELPRVPLHHQGYQIEHGKSIIHGGQALMLMHDLKTVNEAGEDLTVMGFPSTCALKDRKRTAETRPSAEVSSMIDVARKVMVDELNARFFTERPSNSRLVLGFMSKQMPAELWMPSAWLALAKTLYL